MGGVVSRTCQDVWLGRRRSVGVGFEWFQLKDMNWLDGVDWEAQLRTW